jgi:threonine dehydratase
MAEPAITLPVPGIAEIEAARARIEDHVHRTPVLASAHLDSLTGASIFLKCENFQKVGAFKARGATNAVMALAEDEAARGVATHSSGNHGAALAHAAARRGIAATIVMPSTAPAAKRRAVEGYGARIVECGPTIAAREEAVEAVLAATGARFVHPYDDPLVIAGQASCVLEMLEDLGGLDAIVAPVGGGGLISGTCLAVNALAPLTRVYAAEPEGADDALRSLRSGIRQPSSAGTTIADGLRAPLSERTWQVIRHHVADILPVTDAEIVAAMRLVWERVKIVIEPSAAVPVAAILRHRDRFAGMRVGVILTGGNLDLERLPWPQGG